MSLDQAIFAAGVVGAGGAGFPTHKKLAAVELLIINAAECEPLLASDRYVMRHNPDEIIAGIKAVVAAYQIPRAVIATKRHYVPQVAALQAAIERGGGGIEIHAGDSFYPAGDEQTLIYEITGQTVPPGGLPLALGIVVSNVTTALNIARAIEGQPVTRRIVTVTGEVNHPCLVDAPVGTTAADLIAAAGGAKCPSYAFVRGGPMMGRPYPMTEAQHLGYGKADGGLIVLPADHPLITFQAQPEAHLINQAKSACIQCRQCTDLCPRYLIGHKIRPHRVMRAVASGTNAGDLTDALLCCKCGICELFACPMGLSPRRMNIIVEQQLRAQGINQPDRQVYPEQQAERALRHIPQSRLIERLQLGDYPTELDELVRLDPAQVIIATKHGVGQPAKPVVQVGDQVKVGQVIAEVEPAAVGALVHASIAGVVTAQSPARIIIETGTDKG